MSHHGGGASSFALDGDAFLATFERGGFGGDAFPHTAHLRMAWLYVTRLGPEVAIERAAAGIRALAKANGKPTLYHDTLTRAWVYLVANAITRGRSMSFDEFLAHDPRLLDKQLLLEYYSPDVLWSSQAGARWIAPDLAPIPGARGPRSRGQLPRIGSLQSEPILERWLSRRAARRQTVNPYMIERLAEEHHKDLMRNAEAWRLAHSVPRATTRRIRPLALLLPWLRKPNTAGSPCLCRPPG